MYLWYDKINNQLVEELMFGLSRTEVLIVLMLFVGIFLPLLSMQILQKAEVRALC